MQFESEAMSAVFALQKDLCKKTQALSFEHRQAQLQKLLDFVRSKRGQIQTAINADFETRSAHETLAAEIMTSAQEIQHTLKHLKSWMKDTRVGVPYWLQPGKAMIMHQALGCVGIIVPWNYPLYLALSPLCSALAAGNRVMLKMSEHNPIFSAFFKEEMDLIFSNEEVYVVTGGREVSQVFSHLPFDHLLFTGSSAVGKEVMKACAANLTPVTLELGGKSPAVLTPQCDAQDAAKKILFGKMCNAGQTCIAPDYVLVQASQREEFLMHLKEACQKLYPSLQSNSDYTAIINRAQHLRLQALLSQAQRENAQIAPLHMESLHPESRKFAPFAVLLDMDTKLDLMKEEIFGPILPILAYQTLQQALDFINAKDRPLALYVFGERPELIQDVLDHTLSGGVSVNDVFNHLLSPELPFGGVGHSGMGAYHGKTGFDTFSKKKSIFKQSAFALGGLFYPPFGGLFNRVMKHLIGH